MAEQKSYFSHRWIVGALVLIGFIIPLFLISSSGIHELSFLNTTLAALVAGMGFSLGWILWRFPLVRIDRSHLSSRYALFSRTIEIDQIRGFQQKKYSIVLLLANDSIHRIWTVMMSEKEQSELAELLLSLVDQMLGEQHPDSKTVR